MHVFVIGAGAVGSYLAWRLAGEGQEVVVIESDEHRAEEVQEALDALVITGNGASAATLEEAGVADADLLIAVTSNDGANALACHTARELGAGRTVARIEDPELRPGLESVGVDVVIDPGEMAAQEVLRLVSTSGASDLVEFADGRLLLVGGIVRRGSRLKGRVLAELREDAKHWDWNAAVIRDGRTIVARGDTRIEEHDHVVVMTTAGHVGHALDLLGARREPIRRALVLGGTRVAELSTDMLSHAGFDVLVVDRDLERATTLAERHPGALVLAGDPTDPSVLAEQGLTETDAIVALSGWDEVNTMACLIGKSLGAGLAVARYHRISYVRLLIGTGIDAAVSSRLAAANAILRFVRRGRIHSVATFKDSDAEALEIEVSARSEITGCTLADLDLNPLAVVGGIHRNDDAFIPRGDTELQPGDRLIVFAPPEAIGDVEKMCAG